VWSPRAQCDKKLYRVRMREVLEREANLRIKQAEVAALDIENGRVRGVHLRDGRNMRAGAVVVLTSLLRAERPEGRIEVLAAGGEAAWLIDAPYHAGPPHGAGDCFAALFLGYYLTSRSVEDALARSVSAIHLVLAASTGQAELQIIAAQDSFVLREPLFRPRRIR